MYLFLNFLPHVLSLMESFRNHACIDRALLVAEASKISDLSSVKVRPIRIVAQAVSNYTPFHALRQSEVSFGRRRRRGI